MRTTVTLDDELVADAREFTGIEEVGKLIRTAMTALVQREAARQMAELGGTMPNLEYTPRRRVGAEDEK